MNILEYVLDKYPNLIVYLRCPAKYVNRASANGHIRVIQFLFSLGFKRRFQKNLCLHSIKGGKNLMFRYLL